MKENVTPLEQFLWRLNGRWWEQKYPKSGYLPNAWICRITGHSPLRLIFYLPTEKVCWCSGCSATLDYDKYFKD